MSKPHPARTAASRDTVFIAMPFDRIFDPVHDAIEKAIVKARFLPSRVDVLAAPDWLEAIYSELKSAIAVVAVCTCEGRTGVPNPNVMYELGFADCLDAPVIILTDDVAKLPANLKTRTAIPYDPAAPASCIGDLCVSIQNVTRDPPHRSPPPPAPAVVPADRLEWSLTVLRAVKNIHHGFHLLDTLHQLKKAITDELRGPPQDEWDGRAEPCQQVFRLYGLQYEGIREQFVRPVEQQRRVIDDAFERLGDAEPLHRFTRTRVYYKKLMENLGKFTVHHAQLNEEALSGSHDERTNLWLQLDALSRLAREIVSDADCLIFAVIDLMNRNGTTHA